MDTVLTFYMTACKQYKDYIISAVSFIQKNNKKFFC